MSPKRGEGMVSGFLLGFWRGLVALAMVAGLVLLAMALYFQFDGLPRIVAIAGVGLAALALAVLRWRRQRLAFWGLALAVAAAGMLWYSSLHPSNDRLWTADVEHGVTATIDGDVVTLHNVRNFNWTGRRDFTGGWETHSYRLSELTSVDLFSSVWGNPAIAHTLISFGFADGQHVVFSAEIRKQQGQVYTELGGFFRQFNLVLIAAEERDIIRLRTDVRGETVSRYHLNAPPELARRMFLNYAALGNDLAADPRFYNTAITNCTTVIWQMAREVDPGLPLDWRVVLSGYIAGYLQRVGLLPRDVPLAEIEAAARVAPVGPAGPDNADFSRLIRERPPA